MTEKPELINFVDTHLYELKRAFFPLPLDMEIQLQRMLQVKLFRSIYEDNLDNVAHSDRFSSRIGWVKELVEFNPQLTQVSTQCPNLISFPFHAVVKAHRELFGYTRESHFLPRIPDVCCREWDADSDERYFSAHGVMSVVYKVSSFHENKLSDIRKLFRQYEFQDISVSELYEDDDYVPL